MRLFVNWIGISPSHLSPIQPSTARFLAEILPQVCAKQQAWLRAALLVNGAHDQVCTAFGLGINSLGKNVIGWWHGLGVYR